MPGVTTTTTTTTSSLASGNGSLAKVRAWWRQANSGGKYTTAAIFLIPGLALFTLFVVLPMIEAGYYSFFNWNGYGTPTDFVGTRNYEQVLGQKIFHSALWHNVLVIVVSLLIQLPLAMAMALIVAEKIPGNNIFRTIFFLPYILAEIAAGLIWKFVYDGEYGLVAAIFGWFGAQAPFVLASRDWAFSAILVVAGVEVFRLAHDDLYRRNPEHLERSCGGCADGWRNAPADRLVCEDPVAASNDSAFDLFLRARVPPAL
jgi:hypothetical protein